MEAQRALKRGEERLQLMLQGSNDGAWDWNLETGEVYFSPRWWGMLGMRNQERPPGNALWTEFIHPHDALRVDTEIAEALTEDRRSFELEFRMLHRDGSVLTVLDRGFIVRDENQRAIRVSGTLTDISARKRLEQRLEQSEASLSAFFEAIPDCVWFKDTEGRYVLCNPGKARVYGTTVEWMLGKTDFELVPAEEARAYRETDLRALRSTAPLVYEESDQVLGANRVFEVVKRAVHDHSGHPMGVLGVARDITERKQAEAQIERLAFYDPLTHLCNRRLFQDRLEQAQANSVRSGQWAAVCFIDLDNFKDLNDTLGHDTGDELLRQVGERLQQVVREQDTVARLGGDEFVVLFEQLGMEADAAALYANNIGQKILSVLNQPYRLLGAQHHNTPSIGLTLFRDHNERIEDILKRADLAMYQSKSAGRNTVRFFDPNMQAVVMARSALERDLRQAVAVGELVLYYQPVVDAEQRVTGYEALVRWRHPERGMVSPAEFIPVAEQTGLILPIGQWVLGAACEQLARWAADPTRAHLTLAVNLSARQLRHNDFVPDLLAVIERSGAVAGRLKLELTESLLLHDIEETILKMQQLADRGICFALDDFGTGYSSLSYLKRLPLSQLKIDQSFVRDLLTDPNDAAIARTILQLAQSLDLDVVAEGVETEGQRQVLRDMGCKAFQGYLFGRPAPLE
ncbi:putative bifunctional diguanylate cyclase/phosphodiesterase [Hydrogenophaga sp. OTU3427]|uniref:putative bifunctional diguanylate cyclase/phosphodiesterase n=1 Tax=Hydrogenophaga sp. OTU3427 TaxID=3043856 RepID=UPI00406D0A05